MFIEFHACASSPCANGGTCKEVEDAFNCACAPPFAGTKCETSELVHQQKIKIYLL